MDEAWVTVKQAWVKAKVVCRKKAVQMCRHPCPHKILIVHLSTYFGMIDVI